VSAPFYARLDTGAPASSRLRPWVLAACGAIGGFVPARLLDDFVFMPLTLGRSLRIHRW
jgi:hypothetical protein